MIKDIHHIGVAIRDLDAAYAFYRDALGLPLLKEADAFVPGVRVGVLGVGASYMEIIISTEPGSMADQYLEANGEGLHHVAFRSDDVLAEATRLVAEGVPLLNEQPRPGSVGPLFYFKPEAFDGAQVEVVQPDAPFDAPAPASGHITRIDHVVLRVPSVAETSRKFDQWLGVPTKRTMERGQQAFAFMRPGDVVLEVIGPKEGGVPGSGRVAGLAFEVNNIDALTEQVKAAGYPIGEPHPALQGGRIVSVHPSGACGVPVAFIDFTGSPGPAHRQQTE